MAGLGKRGTGGSDTGEHRRRTAAHRLYAQIAWATLGGLPFLDERRAAMLERELIALCRRLDAEPLEVQVSTDRVRLLVRFGPGGSVGDLARRLMGGSGASMVRWGWPARWGRGFAASTVGPTHVHRLVRRLGCERRARAAAAKDAVTTISDESGPREPPPVRPRSRPGALRRRPRTG